MKNTNTALVQAACEDYLNCCTVKDEVSIRDYAHALCETDNFSSADELEEHLDLIEEYWNDNFEGYEIIQL